MILYFTISLSALFFSLIAERKNKFFYLLICILLLTIGSGFRAYTVGTDTHNYHYVFNHYTTGMVYAYGQERGFLEIAKAIISIFKTDRAVFVISAFVTNIAIMSFLWIYRKNCSLFLMSFFYITLFYPETMNIMRQYIGSAIVFFSTCLLFKGKYKSFTIIAIICGFVFHRAILLSVVIAIIWYAIVDNGYYRKTKIVLLSSLSIPFVLSPIISIARLYSAYFSVVDFRIGFTLVLNIAVFISYIYVFFIRKRWRLCEYDVRLEKFLLVVNAIALMSNMVGCFYAQMGRIGLSFSLFKIPFYANMSTNNRYRQIYTVINVLLALYYIIVRVALNGECGIFPYILDFHS